MISRLRDAESIAVVGASPVRGRVGYELLNNLIGYGFRGRIYPVNPKYEEVLGLRCYKSAREVPDEIDLGVVAVPAPSVPEVLRDLCFKGASLAVVVSSGFRERGRADLEEEAIRIARDCGMRIVGPNSAGVTSSPNRLHASIEVLPEPGRVAIVSHSGAVGGVAIHELRKLRSGVSYFISIGNGADVSLEEVLEELAEDQFTDSVVIYAEWVRDGRRFVEALRKLSAGKHVVAVKGGWGEVSSKAVASHTGGVATSYDVFKAVVRQAGGLVAEEIEEAVVYAELLRRLEVSRSPPRVLVVTNTGGYGILASSHLERAGVELPELSRELGERLRSSVGREFSGSNPVDFGGDSRSEELVRALEVDELRRGYDLAVVVYVPTSAESPRDVCESFKRAEEAVPTIYLIAGGGSSWMIRCVSEAKPAVHSLQYLSRLLHGLSALARRRSAQALACGGASAEVGTDPLT